MNTCKNCRYWGVEYSGACDRITLGGGLPRIDAQADDDQGLYAQLMTPEDFGCTLFEAKGKRK